MYTRVLLILDTGSIAPLAANLLVSVIRPFTSTSDGVNIQTEDAAKPFCPHKFGPTKIYFLGQYFLIFTFR